MDDFQKSCYDEAISRGYDEEAAKEIVARARRPEAPRRPDEPVEPKPEQENG